jgi:hypothetical protein
MGNLFSFSSQPVYVPIEEEGSYVLGGSQISPEARAAIAGQPPPPSGFGSASIEGFGGMTNSLFSFEVLYMVLLFVALTPGVLLTLPKGGSKLKVAVVHAVVFVVVLALTKGAVLRALR